ncbi:MAG: HIT domain-containing protein [Candidatus Stahlbacteria bacterium]|nr:HIT domain-containing protein [Candidatus Stahlbacteria bacterium]
MAQSLIEKHGNEILNKIAKLHFKTTNKLTVITPRTDARPVPTRNGLGEPRANNRLWAPWRAEYIYSSKSDVCIFCEAIAKKDAFILSRGAKGFVIMNTFPYNNGHLMVAPYRHIANVEDLTGEEILLLFDLVQKSVRVLKAKMRPDGFNIGINLGKVAGAGVEGHIHIHIVPRWNGDTNFMPITAETKVISQSLEEAYKLLKEGFGEIP